jgi:hypothetical protein
MGANVNAVHIYLKIYANWGKLKQCLSLGVRGCLECLRTGKTAAAGRRHAYGLGDLGFRLPF